MSFEKFTTIGDFLPDPKERDRISEIIYEHIKHGDDEHKKWLRDKLKEICHE